MEEVRIKLPPGTILIKKAACPKGCSLINPDKILSGKPAISALVRVRGVSGLIHFNPYYGIFEYECEIDLRAGDIVGVYCPRCGVSLTTQEQCGICRVPMFAIHLPDGGEVRACPTVGCHNHQLTIVDLDAQFAEYYNEERRPKM
ncbi:MAG: hypothetical protein JXR96_19310 [Deltaproteobacteria bacterium]|nr:hypothetical protein [Deltaproteobacteria bacterium]